MTINIKIKSALFRLRVPAFFLFASALCFSCRDNKPAHIDAKTYSQDRVKEMARAAESSVTPQLDSGLTLRVWGIDSLVADPVSVDIDDDGTLYYTRTNRQTNSEFDIRSHQDWETRSMALQTVEDRRAFLKDVLSSENSEKNKWLADLNGDGYHDWKDLTVEKEVVYSIKDTDADGIADRSQVVIDNFNDEVTDAAGAILKHGPNLFVGIAPDLWMLNDTNGDGKADEKKSLSHGYCVHVGFMGHGMSGLEVGPDGKIYWQIGDTGFNGTGPDGKKWEYPNSGVIVRANPDGSDFEVFAYGNRNTHEFVFDEYGNLITVDNDGDHPGESERLVYVVNGADLGWRINWQFGKYKDPDNNTYNVWMDEKLYVPRFPGQAAYITPPIANYINGPTGMLYNPGTALGPEWKNTFFVGEFVGNPAQSGIHAFKLKENGASFEMTQTKKILGGVLATGIDFGPDGAMYIADWIDGWSTKDYGRIWKLDGSGANSPDRKEVARLLSDDFSRYENNLLHNLLGHVDMRVRQKSQFELASRDNDGFEVFKKVVAEKQNQLARVHAIWGISQLARKDGTRAAVLIPILQDSDPEIRAQAAKWIGELRFNDAGKPLLSALSDENPRVRFFAAEALGRLGYKDAFDPLVKLLETNNDKDAYIRHAASLALARIGNGDRLTELSKHHADAVRMGAVLALRRMRHPGVQQFLHDTNEYVVTEAARAINDDLSIPEALPSLAGILTTTKFKNEALVRRAINANLRIGTADGIQNLLRYAADVNPSAMRAEALTALSTWSKPSVLDRVDGRYRGASNQRERILSSVSMELTRLANDRVNEVRLASVKAIGKLKIDQASGTLLTRLKSDNDPSVREASLHALADLSDSHIGTAIEVALHDNVKSVRIAALDLLPKMNLSNELMVKLLSDVINTKTVEEKQAALTTLSGIPIKNTSNVLDALIVKYGAGKFPLEASLELSDAVEKSGSKELKTKLKSVASRQNVDTLKAAYAGALYGGDAIRGSQIFYNHQNAQCIRCHSYGDLGGSAGPRLNGVAQRITREQILEALINPSARLAPGYGMITLELKNGNTISGILKEDKPNLVTIKVGNRPDTSVVQGDIKSRKYATSSMPPMRLLLTKKEIRDVVSFIATLKD